MTAILKSIYKVEKHFDKSTERFALHHPYLTLLAMFIGMPIFILLAVTVCTTLAALPFALIFGWL